MHSMSTTLKECNLGAVFFLLRTDNIGAQVFTIKKRTKAMAENISSHKWDKNEFAVKVFPSTENPNQAWREYATKDNIWSLEINNCLKKPQCKESVRIVCISDTHTEALNINIPDGDILIHAGDFTRTGTWEEITHFNAWLGTLPHKYKLVIAGNHELSFDMFDKFKQQNLSQASDLLSNCIYLEDTGIQIFGVNFFGTPWQPEFCNWAFNIPRGQPCLDKWEKIPSNTDILITHTPPIGHGDLCKNGMRAGCVELLSTIQQRVVPKYHIFGHIHEGYGITTDGVTKFINAAILDEKYKVKNMPVVFDLKVEQKFEAPKMLEPRKN